MRCLLEEMWLFSVQQEFRLLCYELIKVEITVVCQIV